MRSVRPARTTTVRRSPSATGSSGRHSFPRRRAAPTSGRRRSVVSSTEQVDVVIIGAGVAGGAIAARLLESGDVRAVLLEQGPWIHDVDHAILRDDWEFGISREWAFDPNVRGLDQDYPVTGQGFRPFLFKIGRA